MSNSTISVKSPLNYRQSLVQFKEKCEEYRPQLTIFLWILSGIHAAAKNNFNPHVTGVTFAIPIYELLAMLLSSALLYKGMESRSILASLPWLCVTLYTLYFNHYLSLMNAIGTLKTYKRLSWVPWSTIGMNIMMLIVRITLTIRVIQLGFHLWFKKKLDEMKNDWKK